MDQQQRGHLPPAPATTPPSPPAAAAAAASQMSRPNRPVDLVAAAAAGLYRNPSPGSSQRPAGIPPPHPQPRVSPPYLSSGGIGGGGVGVGSHSRSVSQPPLFSYDALPPLTLPPPVPLAMGDYAWGGVVASAGLPPRRTHRRSQSDIPLVLSQINSPPPLSPSPRSGPQSMKRELEGLVDGDDLVEAYMDLDALDLLDSSGTEEKLNDLDSRGSGNRGGTESSENDEAESRAGGKDGQKRPAMEDSAASRRRHCRSLSMDSFMEKMNFGENSSKLLPSPGEGPGSKFTRSDSIESIGLELGGCQFTESDQKKIAANERLMEMVSTDPKRVKRILANRQSAARSKERKMRYITELENKVQILQQEATTLTNKLTLLQRDSSGLATQNSELKIRLQAMEQQAMLKDALNEALTSEVHRLKLASGEIRDADGQNGMLEQMNTSALELRQLDIQKQQLQIPIPHFRHHQQQ